MPASAIASSAATAPTWRWLRIWLLPAALLGLVQALGGFYYESNDDPILSLLARGVTAAAPVGNLHLWLKLWSHPLAALYGWAPRFPWYDALLLGLMYASLVAAFYVLEAVARPPRRGRHTLAFELLFFGSAYLSHLLEMNFTRPAVLLGAAAGLLLALPPGPARPMVGRWVAAGLLFAAGWGLRTQGAELGLLLVVPLWGLHPWRRAVRMGLYMAGLAGLLSWGAWAQTTPAGATYAYINDVGQQTFDYRHYDFALRTPADSLTFHAFLRGYGPYDDGLLNQAFFQRCVRPAAPAAVGASYRASLIDMARDLKKWQGLALALTLYGWFVAGRAWRRGAFAGRRRAAWFFGGYQVFFWALYLGVALYFHAVARVAHPMMTTYLLGNALLLHGFLGLDPLAPRLNRGWKTGWAVVLAGAFLFAAAGLRRELRAAQAREQESAAYLAQLRAEAAGTTLVEGGLYEVLGGLRLFKSYDFLAYHRILSLAGWSIYDPSQPALRAYLTGRPGTADALLALGRQPRVTWLLKPSLAGFVAKYLNFRLHRPVGQHIRFVPVASRLPAGPGPRRYEFRDAAPASAPFAPVGSLPHP